MMHRQHRGGQNTTTNAHLLSARKFFPLPASLRLQMYKEFDNKKSNEEHTSSLSFFILKQELRASYP